MQLSVHAEGALSHGSGALGSGAVRPEEAVRTETAPLAINPDFANRVFVMRLQQGLGASLQPRALLKCQLWAKPTLERGKCHVRLPHSCKSPDLPRRFPLVGSLCITVMREGVLLSS